MIDKEHGNKLKDIRGHISTICSMFILGEKQQQQQTCKLNVGEVPLVREWHLSESWISLPLR